MSELFLKSLRWAIMALCVVIGLSAFIIADGSGSPKPIMIAIVSFGLIYIMSAYWKDLKEKTLFWGIIIFLALSAVSPYVPTGLFILFGWDTAYFNPFYVWGATVAIAGIPMMMYVFKKYD